jgi:hypothetical protein
VSIFPPEVKYQEGFTEFQHEARRASRGIWVQHLRLRLFHGPSRDLRMARRSPEGIAVRPIHCGQISQRRFHDCHQTRSGSTATLTASAARVVNWYFRCGVEREK